MYVRFSSLVCVCFQIIILEQLYWLTLSIVYITAQATASLFNAGFLLACFFFLWHGQSLYLRPKHTLRKWWKTFIVYNFVVILVKVWLQVCFLCSLCSFVVIDVWINVQFALFVLLNKFSPLLVAIMGLRTELLTYSAPEEFIIFCIFCAVVGNNTVVDVVSMYVVYTKELLHIKQFICRVRLSALTLLNYAW